jgi:CubicO group peptidase (beta-lactamase class C family)
MTMRSATLIAMLTSAACTVSPPADEATESRTEVKARLEAHLEQLAAFGFSGQVLVARGDHVLLEKAYGVANLSTGAPVTTRTAFSVGSLSKQFTAAAVLHLVDRQGLVQSAPIVRYLNDVPADKQAITIHQLLTHTSGLTRDVLRGEQVTDRGQAVKRILDTPLVSAPGTEYGYSNAGYQLLAAIIEEVSGQSLERYLEEHLFADASMDRTAYLGDPRWQEVEDVAHPYNEWTTQGTWLEWPQGWERRGNGGIISTAGEMFTWFRALRGGELLTAESTRALFEPHVARPSGDSYGYGWVVETRADGSVSVGHGGDGGGYHSELRSSPEFTIVLLTNQSLYDDSGFWLGLQKRAIVRDLERILSGIAVTAPPDATAIPAEEHDQYEGRFTLDSGGDVIMWSDGFRLQIGALDQHAIDDLLELTDDDRARFADLNVRSEVILRAVAANDLERLEGAMRPEDFRFFASYAVQDWSDYVEAYGPLVSIDVLGTMPLPWADSLARTQVAIHFADQTLDYHFTWDGDALYETLTELGRPYPVMLPLASIDDARLATLDLVTSEGAELAVREQDGRIVAISMPKGPAEGLAE